MPALSFYTPDALPAAQPTASKHGRQQNTSKLTKFHKFHGNAHFCGRLPISERVMAVKS